MKKFDPLVFIAFFVSLAILAGFAGWQYQRQQHFKYLKSLGLHAAAVHYPELIPEMVAIGLDVNQLDGGRTPLMNAVDFHKLESVKSLLHFGADPNINTGNSINPTVLLSATFIPNRPEDPQIIKLLLKAGADPNARDSNNRTALIRLALNSHFLSALSIAEDLIAAGADVNAEGTDGMTALQYSVSTGNAALADLLLKSGADPEQRNRQGFRAIDQINSSSKAEAIQKIFARHGADTERRPDLIKKYREELEKHKPEEPATIPPADSSNDN